MTTLFLMVGLPGAGKTTRARQLADRWATAAGETFPMTEADILYGWAQFEEPDAAELEGGALSGPPPGWAGWREWAAARWPSFA
ncbi:hypothetical protein ACFWUT_04680 [Streptomyces cyaneofuscatus]|uniref:hypothetical protein n=1 Tax=Streptomyces cyaneofuscatus TaxID=66883 RepID=UPI0036500AE6